MPGANFRVLEDVDGLERHAEMVEDRHCPAGKAALREQRACPS